MSYDSTDVLHIPTRTGYSFDGWYDGADDTGNQVTTATGVPTGTVADYVTTGKWTLTTGKTVYAKWTAEEYTITYNTGEGTVTNPTTDVTYDSTDVLLVPTRTGYSFDGWYDGDDGTGNQVTTSAGVPTGTVADYVTTGKWTLTTGKTVYAKWTAEKYTITSNAGEGTVADPTTDVTYDSTDVLLVPTRTGYSFDGWYDGDDGTGNQVTTSAGVPTGTVADYVTAGKWALTTGKTVYAKWTINQYTVTFSVDGGTTVSSVTQNYNTQIAAAPASTKEGYTLAAWYIDAELNTAAAFPYTITGNSTLYAKWTINQYTVTFSVDSGMAIPPVTQDYHTQIAAAPVSTKEGYTLVGWYTDSGLNTAAAFPYTITGNSTLYAKWTLNEYAITVQNDGNGTAIADQATAGFGETVTLSYSANSGYRFKEWQVVSGDISISNNTFIMPDEPVTVKAIFEAISNNNSSSGRNNNAPSGILISPAGKDATDSGVSLSFPAGAVESDIFVQIQEAALTSGMSLPDDSLLISKVMDIVKNRSGDFAQPVTVTMSFNKSEIDPEKYDIRIYWFDEQNEAWVELDNITVDLDGATVSGQVNHFTKFAVIATRKAEKELPSPAPQPEIKLPDDVNGHWAIESIGYVLERGLFAGTSSTTFSPDMAMERGMLVTVLGRLAGADVQDYRSSSFSDVPGDKYYLPYIEWAYQNGIISGIGNNHFAPESTITRAQIALILQNYTQSKGYTLPVTREATTFTDDADIGDSYEKAVRSMQEAGIMIGDSGNNFNPQSPATRAEVAAILHRYVQLITGPATTQN